MSKAEERALEEYPCIGGVLGLVPKYQMNKTMDKVISKIGVRKTDKLEQYENIVVDHILEQVRKLPMLPPGWEYEFLFDEVYNYEIKGLEFHITANPVQKTIIYGKQ